jgi:acyl-CoA synthetase (NDP forming)
MGNVKSKLGDALNIWGVLVQKMLPPGKEVILGVSRDPKFGPLLSDKTAAELIAEGK